MSSINLLKIALILFVLFAVGEIIFTFQKYGKDIFKPKPGYCKILEEKYCKEEKITEYKSGGKTYTFIGFNFREGERVPIFAVVDGRLLISKENSKEFVGTSAAVQAPNGEVYDFKGNIDTSKFGNLRDISVKAGDIIGYIGPTNAKSLGSYDGVFTISKAGSSGPESQIDRLKILKLLK